MDRSCSENPANAGTVIGGRFPSRGVTRSNTVGIRCSSSAGVSFTNCELSAFTVTFALEMPTSEGLSVVTPAVVAISKLTPMFMVMSIVNTRT